MCVCAVCGCVNVGSICSTHMQATSSVCYVGAVWQGGKEYHHAHPTRRHAFLHKQALLFIPTYIHIPWKLKCSFCAARITTCYSKYNDWLISNRFPSKQSAPPQNSRHWLSRCCRARQVVILKQKQSYVLIGPQRHSVYAFRGNLPTNGLLLVVSAY